MHSVHIRATRGVQTVVGSAPHAVVTGTQDKGICATATQDTVVAQTGVHKIVQGRAFKIHHIGAASTCGVRSIEFLVAVGVDQLGAYNVGSAELDYAVGKSQFFHPDQRVGSIGATVIVRNGHHAIAADRRHRVVGVVATEDGAVCTFASHNRVAAHAALKHVRTGATRQGVVTQATKQAVDHGRRGCSGGNLITRGGQIGAADLDEVGHAVFVHVALRLLLLQADKAVAEL